MMMLAPPVVCGESQVKFKDSRYSEYMIGLDPRSGKAMKPTSDQLAGIGVELVTADVYFEAKGRCSKLDIDRS